MLRSEQDLSTVNVENLIRQLEDEARAQQTEAENIFASQKAYDDAQTALKQKNTEIGSSEADNADVIENKKYRVGVRGIYKDPKNKFVILQYGSFNKSAKNSSIKGSLQDEEGSSAEGSSADQDATPFENHFYYVNLDEPIGKGTYGSVYKSYLINSDGSIDTTKQFATKILSSASTTKDEADKENEIYKRYYHCEPIIKSEDKLYFVSEFFPGSTFEKTVDEIIEKNKNTGLFGFQQRINLLAEMSMAFHLFHSMKPRTLGYNLSLMSINSFRELDRNSLGEKPYLIKDNQGKYRIWGYKGNRWQFTDINNIEIDFEWEQDKTLFISPGDEIFNALKKGHPRTDSNAIHFGDVKGLNTQLNVDKFLKKMDVYPFDFGLAKTVTTDEIQAYPINAYGTPEFIPYEALLAYEEAPTKRGIKSDIYALTPLCLRILGVNGDIIVYEKLQHFKRGNHAEMCLAHYGTDGLFNGCDISKYQPYEEFIKHCIEFFLNRMQDNEYDKRPSSDEVLRFFVTLNNFCKTFDKDSTDEKIPGYLAKLALLTNEAWDTNLENIFKDFSSLFDDNEELKSQYKTFENFDFDSHPGFCQSIIVNSETIIGLKKADKPFDNTKRYTYTFKSMIEDNLEEFQQVLEKKYTNQGRFADNQKTFQRVLKKEFSSVPEKKIAAKEFASVSQKISKGVEKKKIAEREEIVKSIYEKVNSKKNSSHQDVELYSTYSHEKVIYALASELNELKYFSHLLEIEMQKYIDRMHLFNQKEINNVKVDSTAAAIITTKNMLNENVEEIESFSDESGEQSDNNNQNNIVEENSYSSLELTKKINGIQEELEDHHKKIQHLQSTSLFLENWVDDLLNAKNQTKFINILFLVGISFKNPEEMMPYLEETLNKKLHTLGKKELNSLLFKLKYMESHLGEEENLLRGYEAELSNNETTEGQNTHLNLKRISACIVANQAIYGLLENQKAYEKTGIDCKTHLSQLNNVTELLHAHGTLVKDNALTSTKHPQADIDNAYEKYQKANNELGINSSQLNECVGLLNNELEQKVRENVATRQYYDFSSNTPPFELDFDKKSIEELVISKGQHPNNNPSSSTEDRLISEPKPKALEEEEKPGFFERHKKMLLATSFAGAMVGAASLGTVGVLIGLGTIPFFGIGIPLTPFLGAIGAGVGFVGGGLVGFMIGVGLSLASDYRAAKQPLTPGSVKPSETRERSKRQSDISSKPKVQPAVKKKIAASSKKENNATQKKENSASVAISRFTQFSSSGRNSVKDYDEDPDKVEGKGKEKIGYNHSRSS